MLATALFWADGLLAKDVWVLISGGGIALSNRYSQYLQAKGIAEDWRARLPEDSVWVFFGAGNRSGEAPLLADVHRIVERNGLPVATWMPGALPGARPATRDEILTALRKEILPAVADGGVLHLVVGDHGGLTGADEATLTLWMMKRDEHGDWYSDDEEELRVSELAGVLRAGLGKGRVQFVMTQCHSGGFHHLAWPRNLPSPSEWLSGKKNWRPEIAAAGFTSTDEQSPAAGCMSDPTEENWEGYERFWPEAYLGRDLIRGRMLGDARATSAAEAHRIASVRDESIDLPLSTSEVVLLSWADWIEDGLPLASRIRWRSALGEFNRVVSGQEPTSRDAALADYAALAKAEVAQWAAKLPALGPIAKSGEVRQMRLALRGFDQRQAPAQTLATESERKWVELSDLWKTHVRELWLRAVNVQVPHEDLRTFESRLLESEEKRNLESLFLDPDLAEWESYRAGGWQSPAAMSETKAYVYAEWVSRRPDVIYAWSAGSEDEMLRDFAAKWDAAADVDRRAGEAGTDDREATALKRMLQRRRALAAWAFLLKAKARGPLEYLAEVRALEALP